MTNEETAQELTLKKKAKKAVLTIIEIGCGIIAVIFFIITILGISSWVADYQDLSLLVASGFFFAFCIVFAGISWETEKAMKEFRPIIKLDKSDSKQLIYSLFPTFVIWISIFLMNRYFELFPTEINSEFALEILKTLIQTNGFLIGFVGIVFAQLLSTIHSQQSTIQQKMMERVLEKQTDDYFVPEAYLEAFEKKRRSIILSMFFTIILLLGSILISVIGIAQIEPDSMLLTDPNILNPLYFMTYAIVLFAITIIQSKMDIRENVIKVMDKKITEQKKTMKILNKKLQTIKEETKKADEKIATLTEEKTRLETEIEKKKRDTEKAVS
jgi:uncharacterized small protein (DUF1192 family)